MILLPTGGFAGLASGAVITALPQPPTVLYLPDAQHSNVQVFPAYDEALQAFFEGG